MINVERLTRNEGTLSPSHARLGLSVYESTRSVHENEDEDDDEDEDEDSSAASTNLSPLTSHL